MQIVNQKDWNHNLKHLAYAAIGLTLITFTLISMDALQNSFGQLTYNESSNNRRINGEGIAILDTNNEKDSVNSNLINDSGNSSIAGDGPAKTSLASNMSSNTDFTISRASNFNNTPADDYSSVSDKTILSLLSQSIGNSLEKSQSILEFASKLPEVRNLSYISKIDTNEVPGIPPEMDLAKRQVADYILDNYPRDFVSVLFLLPDGDVYLLEPYTRQENLSTSNLSFRDYYQGVVSTKDTFLGNVITSKASGLKQVQLAVPLYADDSFIENKSSRVQQPIDGILSAGLSFKPFDKLLNSIDLTKSNIESIVLIDGKGTVIEYSGKIQITPNDNSNPFSNLVAYKHALNGEYGTTIEKINGADKRIFFAPVKAVSNIWAILLIK